MTDPHRPKVLVIEDDEDLRGALQLTLGRAGLDAVLRADGRSGLRALHELHPHAIVLDIGLPDLDGWQVLERIRDVSDVPVLLLTARSMEFDKVRGLQAGADDYLTKPFGNAELVARVHALLRRPRGDEAEGDDVLVDDRSGVRMELRTRRVLVDGETVPVSPLEWRLLLALEQHRGQVLSAEQLLELAWNDPIGASPERVKFAVLRLRRKLGRAGRHIENVRGFGYRI
ncbi:MAG: response regulator transcription factor [Nocardioidaceae bacterium]